MLSGYFKSNFGNKNFKASTQWHASYFQIHSPSEHLIDGNRYDLELHTVHVAPRGVVKNKIEGAFLSIIFDTNEKYKYVPDETI